MTSLVNEAEEQVKIMSDNNNRTSLTKYIVAAAAAVLVIGVTVTAVMIRSHRKGNIVIQKTDSDISEQSCESFSSVKDTKLNTQTTKTTKTAKADSEAKSTKAATAHTTKSASVTTAVDFPIDINHASEQQLCAISGIGPSTAKSIIDHRNSIGKFGRIEQLLDVDGIGEKTFQKLKQYLYVSQKDIVTTIQSTGAEKEHTTPTKKTAAITVKSSAVSDTAESRRMTATTKESSEVTSEHTISTDIPKPEELNINQASTEEFALFFDLPLEKAQKITEAREKIHGFTNILQLLYSGVVSEDQIKAVHNKLKL